MSSKPEIGDVVEHPFLGSDANIEIAQIPRDQPVLETDGMYVIVDQYGENHLVDLDGDAWIVSNPEALSPEGADLWDTFIDNAPTP